MRIGGLDWVRLLLFGGGEMRESFCGRNGMGWDGVCGDWGYGDRCWVIGSLDWVRLLLFFGRVVSFCRGLGNCGGKGVWPGGGWVDGKGWSCGFLDTGAAVYVVAFCF